MNAKRGNSKLPRHRSIFFSAGILSDDVSKKAHFGYYHNQIPTMVEDTQYP